MKRFDLKRPGLAILAVCVGALGLAFPALAKGPGSQATTPAMRATERQGGASPAPGMAHVTGPVKGAVTGKTFVIARKGGTVTVDASGAKIREKGKFTSISAIKGGVMVTATGMMSGTTLKATEVEIHARGGKGGKMAGKMTPGKKGAAPPKPPKM